MVIIAPSSLLAWVSPKMLPRRFAQFRAGRIPGQGFEKGRQLGDLFRFQPERLQGVFAPAQGRGLGVGLIVEGDHLLERGETAVVHIGGRGAQLTGPHPRRTLEA